jgi:hypothetical protein
MLYAILATVGARPYAAALPQLPPLHIIIDQKGGGASAWATFIPLLAAVGALVGVVLNILSIARLQRKTRELDRINEIRTARSVLFAQLSRVYRTTQGEYEYLAKSGIGWIWISLYATLLPSEASLRKIQLLSAEEVLDVTAFFYSYHEHMGYIAALTGGHGKSSLAYDFQLVGADCTDATRELLWLLKSLAVIERKALAAMEAILRAAERDYKGDVAFLARLTRERDRSKSIAAAALLYKRELVARTGEDFTKPKSAEGISEAS